MILSKQDDAFDYIMANMNTGEELSINDTLFFGVGNTLYAYSQDVEAAGYSAMDSAFTHLNPLDNHLIYDILEFIESRDGILIAD